MEELTSDPITRTFLYCPDSTNFAPVFSAYTKPEQPAETSKPQVFSIPSLCCTRQAVEGYIMSGVTVPTTIRSTSCRLNGWTACSFFTASTAKSLAATPLSTRWRSRMPTRSMIHWLVVSTIFSRSAFVKTRGGTYPATPVIFAATRRDMMLLGKFEPLVPNVDSMRSASAETSGRLRSWCGQNFVTPRNLRRFLQHGRHGAVFIFGQFDRVL